MICLEYRYSNRLRGQGANQVRVIFFNIVALFTQLLNLATRMKYGICIQKLTEALQKHPEMMVFFASALAEDYQDSMDIYMSSCRIHQVPGLLHAVFH